MRIYLDVCCLNRPYDDQTADADVFLSTDDKLIRAAKRQKKAIKGGMEVENPLTWLQSIFK